MAPLVSTIDIARPPQDVFSYVADPTRFAEWQHDVVRVQTDGNPLDPGSTFTTIRRIGGVERTMTQEVVEVRAPGRWVVRGIDGPIRPQSSVTIEPLDGGARSRITFTLDFTGHGIGVPIVALVRRQASRQAPTSYQNLKRRLENGR
jgi:uncharacterized protein YndB with AHSA1/START domain